MPLETALSIADLDDTWPLGGDPTSRGDDHIRLIKAVLKTQFPGSGTDGFASPIVATEAELNRVAGVTSPIQTQLNNLSASITSLGQNLSAPSGTRMTFHQVSAPAGWTMDVSLNDYMLRVVSSGGGASGGSQSPINLTLSHTHSTGDFVLGIPHLPSHTHFPAGTYNRLGGGQGPDWASGDSDGVNVTESAVGGNQAHNHGATGVSLSSFTPRYLNMIIGVKT